ncbi:MAG: hypothetical protein IKX71_00140 [Bacteroidales bacterium]|nr:hypothetical protein [Bacteroidales bacterium]
MDILNKISPYEAPEAEIFEIKTVRNILQGTNYGEGTEIPTDPIEDEP